MTKSHHAKVIAGTEISESESSEKKIFFIKGRKENYIDTCPETWLGGLLRVGVCVLLLLLSITSGIMTSDGAELPEVFGHSPASKFPSYVTVAVGSVNPRISLGPYHSSELSSSKVIAAYATEKIATHQTAREIRVKSQEYFIRKE